MASLSIAIGALSRSKTAADAKASELMNAYADSLGATGTNAQRADAVLDALARHMVEQARRHRRNVETEAALAAVQAALDALGWE